MLAAAAGVRAVVVGSVVAHRGREEEVAERAVAQLLDGVHQRTLGFLNRARGV